MKLDDDQLVILGFLVLAFVVPWALQWYVLNVLTPAGDIQSVAESLNSTSPTHIVTNLAWTLIEIAIFGSVLAFVLAKIERAFSTLLQYILKNH